VRPDDRGKRLRPSEPEDERQGGIDVAQLRRAA
jgi:hypothetical protein